MKEFLSQRNIPFTDKDIKIDPRAKEEWQAKGYSNVPVTEIDGEVIHGLEWERIHRALGVK